MAKSDLELNFKNYEEVRSHLISLDQELEVIINYVYDCETQGDTVLTDVSEEVTEIGDNLRKYLDKLWIIVKESKTMAESKRSGVCDTCNRPFTKFPGDDYYHIPFIASGNCFDCYHWLTQFNGKEGYTKVITQEGKCYSFLTD